MSLQRRNLSTGIECVYLDTPADVPAAEHWEILEHTTALIPVGHRTLLQHIELRGHGESPASGGGNFPETGTVRLSYASLRATYNRPYNVTLLHEFGHLIERHYNVAAFVSRQGANGQALLHTGHSGRTQGPPERIADCYMIYLIQVIAGRHYTHNADPTAYQGAAARMRFGLLLQSPAFAGMTGYHNLP